MRGTITSNKFKIFIILYYIILLVWWVRIFSTGQREGTENYLFGVGYSFIALSGGIYGFYISKKWGGLKSLVGKGIVCLSLGLLLYWFGQIIWSYYNLILNVEAPYPSLADLGYFSVIPAYFTGMFFLAKASGVKLALQKLNGKIIALIIPALIVCGYFYFFLQYTEIDFSLPLKMFLDVATPLGYASILSIAIVAYILSNRFLGGAMRSTILLVIVALVVQNITDDTFLYQFSIGSYYNGGINDLMFATSFTLMAVALSRFNNTL